MMTPDSTSFSMLTALHESPPARVLVTGGCGFIGSHLVHRLVKEGHEVRVIDALTYAGNLANLPEGFRGLRRGDITDRELMVQLVRDFRPDWIVHAAAETHVGRSIDSADTFLTSNVIGTHNMLRAALAWFQELDAPAQMRFRFLHVSTDEVFGDLDDEHNDREWTEESPYAPNNPYAASKAAADHLVRSFQHTHGLPTIITNGSNTYGVRQHPEKLIPTLIGQCLAGHPMTLHGDGQNVRTWMSVDDHVAGILMALQGGAKAVGNTFVLGTSDELTNFEVAQLLRKFFPGHPIVLVADRPGNDRRYAVNPQRAYSVLHWNARDRLVHDMGAIVEWHRANPCFHETYGLGAAPVYA